MTDPDCLLSVDVGNSRIKIGLFRIDGRAGSDGLPECLNWTAVPLADPVPWDRVTAWFQAAGVSRSAGVVAGANPAGVDRVTGSWPDSAGAPPLIVSDPTGFPLRVKLDSPRQVGVDRLLNAVAANVLRPVGRPCVIIDSGTASTVDLISPEGAFLGGAILPGLELSARSLHQYTALLPLIDVDELATEPHDPLGTSTRAAMRSGLIWGQLGAVKELTARLADSSNVASATNQKVRPDPFVLLTGGGARLLSPHLPEALCAPHLALQGLVIVRDSLYT